uniref:7-dehydrocholesterol reductase n=1 Tax=Plectus sambesii TaxID=2011161 RepID=A0A914USL1_9BILA
MSTAAGMRPRRQSSGSSLPPSGRRSSVSLRDVQVAQALVAQQTNKMWSNQISKSFGLFPGRQTWGPALLVVVGPLFVIVYNYAIVELDGSIKKLYLELQTNGIVTSICKMWPSCRDLIAWKIIGIFIGLQLVLSRILPGDQVRGPTSPAGYIPTYTLNGFSCFLLTALLYVLGVFLRLYKGSIIWANFGPILSSMNVLVFALCFLLYIKGLYLPTGPDHGTMGNPLFDFYWGTELHPKILGWDVKQFLTCRVGMTFWGLYIISAVLTQIEWDGYLSDGLLASAGLQLVYVIKFHWWESGYVQTMDMQHDRAGFYRVWGALVFVPAVYFSPVSFLVIHPSSIGRHTAILAFVFGVICTMMTYDIDRQRELFRAAGGNKKIWGRDPYFITAKYKTESGETKANLLLGSGWWGISRHFHFVTELGVALSWIIPVWTKHPLPYLCLPFITCLLLDRAYRDEARCLSKYGPYWLQYCNKVPDLILPGVF